MVGLALCIAVIPVTSTGTTDANGTNIKNQVILTDEISAFIMKMAMDESLNHAVWYDMDGDCVTDKVYAYIAGGGTYNIERNQQDGYWNTILEAYEDPVMNIEIKFNTRCYDKTSVAEEMTR